MKNYLLRNIPSDLWATAKERAAIDGHSLRFVILTLLQHYAAHGLRRSGA